MKKGLTKIVFVVDRSGSMSTIAKDMIGGFNAFIKKQKENKTDCQVSFYQFDTVYDIVFENTDVQLVEDLTDKTFVPRGGTALLDAVGKTINNVGAELSAMPEDQRPEKILVIIITDGEENSSTEFTSAQVKSMVEHQQTVYNWEFNYLGSNQETWKVAAAMGIARDCTLSYVSMGSNATTSSYMMWNTISTTAASWASGSCAKSLYSLDIQDEQERLIKSNIL